MIEHSSASAMSELEPSPTPAPVVTSKNGDASKNMAELERSGSAEPNGNEETSDKPSGDQTTDDQPKRDQPTDDQHKCDQPTTEKPVCDKSTDGQPNGDQSTDDHPACDQSTDYQPNGDQSMGDQPAETDPTHSQTEVSLIAEVQKYPYIFNQDYRAYFERQAKNKQWEDVCEGLFPQWSTLSSSKKKEITIMVQKKWAKIRESFFESYGGIRKHLTNNYNVKSSLNFRNTLGAKYPYEFSPEVDHQYELARKYQEENARRYQNASTQHDLGEYRIPVKVPPVELTKLLNQPVVSTTCSLFNIDLAKIPGFYTAAVPSTSAQLDKNQGHNPGNSTAAVPSTSAQLDKTQGHKPEISAAAVPSTSDQLDKTQGHNTEISTAAVPSTSAQFNENQGNIQGIPTAAVPSTSAQFNEKQGHIPEILTAAVPSTSAQNNQGENDFLVPLPPEQIQASFHNIAQPNPALYQNLPINLTTLKPHYVQVIPTTNEGGEWVDRNYLEPPLPGEDKTVNYASILCAMLEKLDYDQQCAVWPKLMSLISDASKSKPKKIKILQGELLSRPDSGGFTRMPAMGPEIVLQPFVDPELEIEEQFAEVEVETVADTEIVDQEPFAGPGLAAQEQFVDPELGIQQTLTTGPIEQETMTDEEMEEECIYPSSHGRPTNAQGEIMYPETEEEDLDEE